jgi:beta-phosphoglucomutase
MQSDAPLRPLSAVIFDVDDVLVASPHERAWREALRGITEPAPLTAAIYQACVAGKPRLAGARAILERLGYLTRRSSPQRLPSASRA